MIKAVSYGFEPVSETQFENKVFWIFVFINFEFNWRLVYKNGTPKALSLVRILDKRIEQEVPEIHKRMKYFDIIRKSVLETLSHGKIISQSVL